MTEGRHETKKHRGDPTFSVQWSGVSYVPKTRGKLCSRCKGHVYNEGGNYYCPYCDDYVSVIPEYMLV